MKGRKGVTTEQTASPGHDRDGETAEQRAACEREVFSQSEKFNILALEIIVSYTKDIADPEFQQPDDWVADGELAYLRNQIVILRQSISNLKTIKSTLDKRLKYLRATKRWLTSPDWEA